MLLVHVEYVFGELSLYGCSATCQGTTYRQSTSLWPAFATVQFFSRHLHPGPWNEDTQLRKKTNMLFSNSTGGHWQNFFSIVLLQCSKNRQTWHREYYIGCRNSTRDADRPINKQTDKQTDRQTDRQTDKQTDRHLKPEEGHGQDCPATWSTVEKDYICCQESVACRIGPRKGGYFLSHNFAMILFESCPTNFILYMYAEVKKTRFFGRYEQISLLKFDISQSNPSKLSNRRTTKSCRNMTTG